MQSKRFLQPRLVVHSVCNNLVARPSGNGKASGDVPDSFHVDGSTEDKKKRNSNFVDKINPPVQGVQGLKKQGLPKWALTKEYKQIAKEEQSFD